MNANRLLGPWRRRFQWLTALTVLLVPWIQFGGQSLLRLDIGSLSLHLFGQTLHIEELYLFLFFTLAFTLFFLLVTLVFGRIWCGWACPQTTLSDVAEWWIRNTGLRLAGHRLQGSLGRKILAHAGFLFLAVTVAMNLVWYFIEPQRMFSEIFRGELHWGAWGTLGVVAATVYLDLAFVRRLMCRDFCPYGRFQTALVDPGTLTLLIPASEASRCIECGSCVRACPMGIDIRRGYQVECINCGRCLDACRLVMTRRNEPGLIRYSFGYEGRGPRALLHPRTLLLGVAFTALVGILTGAILLRSEASLKIAVSHTATSRLLDENRQVTFFSAWVGNRTQQDQRYEVSARLEGLETPPELKGQVAGIDIAPGQNRHLEFALLTPPRPQATTVTFELHDQRGEVRAQAAATVLPLDARENP